MIPGLMGIWQNKLKEPAFNTIRLPMDINNFRTVTHEASAMIIKQIC